MYKKESAECSEHRHFHSQHNNNKAGCRSHTQPAETLHDLEPLLGVLHIRHGTFYSRKKDNQVNSRGSNAAEHTECKIRKTQGKGNRSAAHGRRENFCNQLPAAGFYDRCQIKIILHYFYFLYLWIIYSFL